MSEAERLRPLSSADLPAGDARRGLARLEALGKDVHMARLLAGVEHVFRPYVMMSDALMNRSQLEPRLRELAILRLARRMDVAYEWWEHASMALGAGVSEDEVQAIGRHDVSRWADDPPARYVLDATDEWLSESPISDPTWEEGVHLIGRAALVDLVLTWAWWGAWVPAVVRGFAIGVPEGDPGSTAT